MSESSLFELFIEETKEHLEKIDEALLLLEKDPENMELINALFRSVHTIKGSTAAMSYNKTAQLIHQVEDLIHLVREEKLKVNQKMIQLLFVTHDFLENFIDTVMQNGNEGELKSEHILEEVQSFLSVDTMEQGATQKNRPSEGIAARTFNYKEEEFEAILHTLDSNEEIFVIRIRLSSNCVFKSIRVWMIFEEIDKVATVISSYPEKPSIDDFKNGTFAFDEHEVLMVISSERVKNALASNIEKLSEIDDYDIAQLQIQDRKSNNQPSLKFDNANKVYQIVFEGDLTERVNNIIDTQGDGLDVSFPEGFLDEIKVKARKAEASLVLFLKEANGLFDFNKTYRYFHTLKGLGSYIDHILIQEVARETEDVLEKLRKIPDKLDETVIDKLRLSAQYVITLCENPQILSDKQFTDEITKHIRDLQRIKEQDTKTWEDQEDRVQNNQEGQSVQKNATEAADEAAGEAVVETEPLFVVKNEQTPAGIAPLTIKKEQSLIRVPESKIDYLVDMLGELIIFQSQHKQEVIQLFQDYGINENKIFNGIAKMERITKDLQNLSMSLRMVSLKQTLQKLSRIGRDSALELGKTINIHIVGEDTEIDRSVVEKIQDPLMHLVRNAISHGIEEDAQRRERGKEVPGQVTIEAYNRRGNVYIEIKDDGKGLDLDRIYQKALQNGQITKEKEFAEEEIIRFIFLPGLSTQEKLNAISGRGVGMNVVETEIKKIGGRIEILNNPGKGCTFILKIPINLATINGTIVEICGQRFILPTVNIKHIFKPNETDWVSIKGRTEFVKRRDQLIPLIPTEKFVNTFCNEKHTNEAVVIILEMDQGLRALPVSNILDKQEVVQKPLGNEFASAKIFSGGTILGDGKVCLILDIESLFKSTY